LLTVGIIYDIPLLYYSLVTIVHCETSSGVLNRPEEIAKLVCDLQPQAAVFVDAMSSFGAIPINLENIDFLVSSANKCLEGIPGFSYAICRKSKLSQCKGNLKISLCQLIKFCIF
jgi:2-aminoethylphosphonate-pyruvate transaminase